MAILTALISYIARQLGTVLRAILGWSVSALFGRLSSARATVLSGLLVASLLWPVLLVGIFFPAVSAWAFALLPLQKWFGAEAVRRGTIVLVVCLPMVIGLVVRAIAPSAAKKGSALRTMLGGYPLTIGFALACLVTAVLVPLVKVQSIARGWADWHVYVEPKRGRYAAALHELERACTAAGVTVRVESVPRAMDAGTRVLKFFARGTLDALMAENARRLVGKDLEVYLYPADLLLRGEADNVSRVRARMMDTNLELEAFLVAEPHAQVIQASLGRIALELERNGSSERLRRHERARLERIRRLLEERPLPFDEWLLLDRTLRRLALGASDRTGARPIVSATPDHLAGPHAGH
jgi:hypothetical protein